MRHPFQKTLLRPLLSILLVVLLLLTGGIWLFSHLPEGSASPLDFGAAVFLSSDQTTPDNRQGKNDEVSLTLHHLAVSTQYVAWLMPDASEMEQMPLLLGTLAVTSQGDALLLYEDPEHRDLLARYSGVEITKAAEGEHPSVPSLDPQDWTYRSSLAAQPSLTDHFSYLDHIRHLLASDPTLQAYGIPGGLLTWLVHNTRNLLQWAGDAQDNWQGGLQTALIHRHMLRILDVLDGVSFVAADVPVPSPFLVDPLEGRIGLLTFSATLPGYVAHVLLHLRGVAAAPGHTHEQAQHAILLEQALLQDENLLQRIRLDALQLVSMTSQQLQAPAALALINAVVIQTTDVYDGQYTGGGNSGGVTWIERSVASDLSRMPFLQVMMEEQ